MVKAAPEAAFPREAAEDRSQRNAIVVQSDHGIQAVAALRRAASSLRDAIRVEIRRLDGAVKSPQRRNDGRMTGAGNEVLANAVGVRLWQHNRQRSLQVISSRLSPGLVMIPE